MIIKTVSLRHGFLLGSVLATGLFVSANVAAQSAAAQQTIAIDLAAQPLEQAITQLATQAGLLIGVDASLVAGKQAPALNGRFTPLQAIGQLLKGSGLIVIENAPGRYTLEAAPAGHTNSNTEAVTLPEMKITGMIDPNSPDNRSYSRPSSFSATKTDTRIMETPMSIQVIPRVVMNDQKTTTIKDALENVSSVRPQSSLGRSNAFIIRGFRNGRVYRNGLVALGLSIGEESMFDSANLESIEVLKGPASILYGRIEPGGLINLTTKKPRGESYYSIEQRFGSYNSYRTEWDGMGPVTKDKSLNYRFSGSYQNNRSFRDFNFNDRVLVNPALTWRPGDATELSLEVEALHEDYQVDRGLFAIGDRPAPIPVTRSFIDPDDPVDTHSRVNLGFNLTHAFNTDWTLRNRFLASFVDDDNTSVKPANAFTVAQFLDPSKGNRTYLRNIFSQISSSQTYTTNLDLTGNLEFLGTRHQTLVGFDYLRSTGTYLTRGNYLSPVSGLEIDIYNPVYGIDPSFYAQALATPFPAGENHSFFKDEWYGVYFQDHITLWDKLHILGGGRYEWATTGRGRGDSFRAAEANLPTRKDNGFSPRVGILYQPWSWASIYGNWTTSFGASNGITNTGATIDPERGEQFEAGLKAEWFDQRLTMTFAYYHLTKENILTRDFNSPDPFAVAAIGKARSQGIEFDLSGQITDELSVIGNYAFTDARITRDYSGLQGNRLSNVPEHSGSLWLKYDIRHYQPLNGWQFGMGIFAAGLRQGDNENTFALPGYVRLDALVAYRMKLGPTRLTAQVNIRNLLDKRYYESTDPFVNAPPRAGIYPGAPLTILGSLRLEY